MRRLLKRNAKFKGLKSIDDKQATMFLASRESEKLVEDNQEEVAYKVVEMEIKPAHIICPDCGGITIEGLDYCHKCGGELKPSD